MLISLKAFQLLQMSLIPSSLSSFGNLVFRGWFVFVWKEVPKCPRDFIPCLMSSHWPIAFTVISYESQSIWTTILDRSVDFRNNIRFDCLIHGCWILSKIALDEASQVCITWSLHRDATLADDHSEGRWLKFRWKRLCWQRMVLREADRVCLRLKGFCIHGWRWLCLVVVDFEICGPITLFFKKGFATHRISLVPSRNTKTLWSFRWKIPIVLVLLVAERLDLGILTYGKQSLIMVLTFYAEFHSARLKKSTWLLSGVNSKAAYSRY